MSGLMDHQRISVVIPVYNGARTISHTIECVLQQSLKPVDILVVDDGSTDDTAEILKRYGSKIVYIPKQNGGPASARNLGVQFAGGEYVAFTDSDCQPDVHWLRNLMKGFDDQEIGGVGGQSDPPTAASPVNMST
ncbi:MAG: glycosyltransferase family 2 protein [Acidobacteria bacterium]|nr:glycosyltransferase family 2 protein [Acidobacteriota bacterium]